MSTTVVLIIGRAVALAEEIAHVIAFGASANASYMTGGAIPVDGGMLAD